MFDVQPPNIDWQAILPVIIVCLAGLATLLVEMFRPRQSNETLVGISLAGLVLSAISTVASLNVDPAESFGGMVRGDNFGMAMQLVILIGSFLAILFSEEYLRAKRIPFGEFYPLVLWSTAGAMIMATTTNLLMLFVGLEVLSISLYVLAGMSKTESKSEESALKYFLLGAFASGFLLYGIAFIYGGMGTLHLSDIASSYAHGSPMAKSLVMFGIALILIGLSFKAALAPFHQWTPDVYQGAPTNVTAFMAAISKVAAFAALWRVLGAAIDYQAFWMPILFWIAIITMCVGNLVACVQKDVKRILGYSSIAHAGYILVGVLAHYKNVSVGENYTTLVYYLLSYVLMTVGAFAVISLGAKEGSEKTRLEDLNGLYKRSPFAAICLWIFMFSLIGMPPSAGFFGKLFVFSDALNAGLAPLAIVLAINSVISIYYYAGIAWAAYVSDGTEEQYQPRPISKGVAWACGLCVAGILCVAVFQSQIMPWLGAQ